MNAFRNSAVLIAWIALTLLFAVPSRSALAEDVPATVRLSWFGSAGPWILGKEDGKFDKELGTKVEWIQVASGGAALTSLAANSIDIALLGSPPTTAAIVRGLPIKVIALEGVIAKSERLVTHKDIGTAKSLEGKRIAYPPGSSSHYGLMAALKVNDVDAAKVKLIGLAPADMVAAWKRGDIDGGFVWSPFANEMEASGGRVLVSMKDLQPHGYFVWNDFVVRREFAEKYPKMVVGFLKAYNSTVKEYKVNPEKASQTIAKYLNQDVNTVRETLAGRDYYSIEEQLAQDWIGKPNARENAKIAKGFSDTADFLTTNGDLRKSSIPKSFADSIDPGFAARAVQQ